MLVFHNRSIHCAGCLIILGYQLGLCSCHALHCTVEQLIYLAPTVLLRISELSIHNIVFLHSKYYENLTKMTEQMSQSGFFLSRSHIGRESVFGIFKQNRGNPDEIEMVGQSEFSTQYAFDSADLSSMPSLRSSLFRFLSGKRESREGTGTAGTKN